MSRARKLALGVLALALSLTGLWREPPQSAGRFLGPVASLAASVEWVRMQLALDAGRTDLAYERAEHALALDPGATDGWSFFAAHLVFDRGSRAAELDPARRWAWVRRGLDLLERGERTAREPARLVLYRGAVHVSLAETGGSPERSAEEHRARAQELFARAGEMGLDIGAELAESLEHDHEHHQ